jgi:hypothetical protein
MIKKHKQKIKPNEIDQPTIKIGSHLTVYTYPDGNVELKWDDEALLRDVRNALAQYDKEQNILGK